MQLSLKKKKKKKKAKQTELTLSAEGKGTAVTQHTRSPRKAGMWLQDPPFPRIAAPWLGEWCCQAWGEPGKGTAPWAWGF